MRGQDLVRLTTKLTRSRHANDDSGILPNFRDHAFEGSENIIPFRNLEEGEPASVKAGEAVAKYAHSAHAD